MKLSELKTGEQGVIVKVLGHGGFRKRIIEMGFIKGQTVEVLQNAPLQDPVKYRLMGYEVSLRHQEAAQVEVVSVSEAHEMEQQVLLQGHEEDYLQHRALQQRRTIHVALVGNPNCGKTSLSLLVPMLMWATIVVSPWMPPRPTHRCSVMSFCLPTCPVLIPSRAIVLRNFMSENISRSRCPTW